MSDRTASCQDCGATLAVPGGRGRLPKRCKECRKAYNRAYQRAKYVKRLPRAVACKVCGTTFEVSAGGRRSMCSDACRQVAANEASKRYASRNPARVADATRKSKYGVRLANVLAVVEAQGGCAICGTTVSSTGRKQWTIDHDHRCCPSHRINSERLCGQCFRGVLCDRCNKGLGVFDDDPELLLAAAHYLQLSPVGSFAELQRRVGVMPDDTSLF